MSRKIGIGYSFTNKERVENEELKRKVAKLENQVSALEIDKKNLTEENISKIQEIEQIKVENEELKRKNTELEKKLKDK